MTQLFVCLIEYCWISWMFLVGVGVTGLFLVTTNLRGNGLQKNVVSSWTTPWWDVWNFYYINLFGNLNNTTKAFFQVSWNEWHVLDIRMFFLTLSIIFVVFTF